MTVNNTVPPTISGTAQQGRVLTTTNGDWTYDLDFLTYDYQWLRCDAAGASCVDIATAVQNSYTLQAADVGSTIRSEVTATEHSTPAPPGGDVLFDGSFDTGNISQWDNQSSGTPAEFLITTGIDGVTPRQGTHFAKVTVKSGEPAFGSIGGRNASMVQTGSITGASALGNDFYTGFSVYIPNTFVYPTDLGNNIIEWHCPPTMEQAPVHFMLDGGSGGAFSLDIHTDKTGYNPKPVWGGLKFGPLVKGQWVDFVFRIKWSTSPSGGLMEGWMNGVQKFSQTLQTWGAGTTSPYLVAGYYRTQIPQTVSLYLDAIKVGTTYASVAP